MLIQNLNFIEILFQAFVKCYLGGSTISLICEIRRSIPFSHRINFECKKEPYSLKIIRKITIVLFCMEPSISEKNKYINKSVEDEKGNQIKDEEGLQRKFHVICLDVNIFHLPKGLSLRL